MLLIQIFLVLFFLFVTGRVVSRYRQGDLSLNSFIFWLIFWILSCLVVIIPNSSAYFAKIFGIGRGADLIVYLSLALLFYLIFKLNIKLEKINKNITKLTREEALEKKEEK